MNHQQEAYMDAMQMERYSCIDLTNEEEEVGEEEAEEQTQEEKEES